MNPYQAEVSFLENNRVIMITNNKILNKLVFSLLGLSMLKIFSGEKYICPNLARK